MSDPLIFERHAKLPPPGKTEEGRPTCRACGKEVPRGRRSFCSVACAEDAAIRSSGPYARIKVEERDKGVCAECGMDTEYVRRTLEPLLREAKKRTYYSEGRSFAHNLAIADALRARVCEELGALGFSPATYPDRWRSEIAHLWEMDHILPVIRGGGGCGLANLRTLCRRCHHHATKKLAGERGKERRIARKHAEHLRRMQEKHS